MNLSAIVLAAGKGTRMKSILPKVLHQVFFTPMVCHVLASLNQLDLKQIIVVTGHEHELVEERLTDYDVTFVLQEEQNGTGHAVQICESALLQATEQVLIVCGDSPLISSNTLQLMIDEHIKSCSDVTVLSTEVDDPAHYGRMVCDSENQLLAIIEEKDASADQKEIKEINGGIYIVRKDVLFSSLKQTNTENMQGELYLTDIVRIANDDQYKVSRVICDNPVEVMGVNSRQELMKVHDIMQNYFYDHLLDNGVSLIRPMTSSIHPTVKIGTDSCVYANVSLGANVVVGSFCQIYEQCYIKNSYIGDNVIIGAGSKLVGANIPSNSIINPASVMIFENEIKVARY
jgi:bifunctional UDP-N-acetylglucosamine pyrophosphorylase/glucosamine-1-phosphate N-acetyltransferase